MHSFSIALAIFIWSSLGVFVRKVGLEVPLILLYSTGFSLIFQSIIFTKEHFRKQIPSFRKMPHIMLLALVLLLNTFTFLFAYQKTTFANAVLTHYIAPVLVAVLAWFFLKEKITRLDLIAISMAMFGLWIMFGGGSIKECLSRLAIPPEKMDDETIGILSGLASGFFYALLIVMIRAFVKRENPYVLVFFQNLFVLLYLLPFYEPVQPRTLIFLSIMGLIHSTIAPYLYYFGLKGVQAHRAAILGYLEPLGSIIFGMLFFKEMPGPAVFAGGTLILVSGYISIKQRNGK